MAEIVTRLYVAGNTQPESSPEFYLGVALDPLIQRHEDMHGRLRPRGILGCAEAQDGITFGRDVDEQQQKNPYYRLIVGHTTGEIKHIPNISDDRRATACATIATDLLLDSILGGKKSFLDTRKAILGLMDEAAGQQLVTGEPDLDWTISDYFSSRRWHDYREAKKLVRIIHDRLAARRFPDLRFGEEALPRLEEIVKREKRELQDRVRPLIGMTCAVFNGELRLPT